MRRGFALQCFSFLKLFEATSSDKDSGNGGTQSTISTQSLPHFTQATAADEMDGQNANEFESLPPSQRRRSSGRLSSGRRLGKDGRGRKAENDKNESLQAGYGVDNTKSGKKRLRSTLN